MMINLILFVLLVALIVKYKDIMMIFNRNVRGKKELFDAKHIDNSVSRLQKGQYEQNVSRTVNDVFPDGNQFTENNIVSHGRLPGNCERDECDRIDNYRRNFFGFNDRINHNTHLDDPVDMINISNKGEDYFIGQKISDIYDDLTKNNYKD
jgi:alpha-glucuronidase